MATVLESLPNDPELLKALGREQHAELERLREHLKLLLAKRYGPSSEKVPAEQLRLFNEAEHEAPSVPEPQPIVVAAHARAKPGRRPLPEGLARVAVVHDLSEEAKVCGHDGERLVEIGREESEQLDIIPAQARVLRHVRIKSACPYCHRGVKTAPMPPQPIPKSIASPGLLAHVAVAKYQDGLPLYRQESILQRSGVDLPRATLAGWMVRIGVLIQPLINLLRDHSLFPVTGHLTNYASSSRTCNYVKNRLAPRQCSPGVGIGTSHSLELHIETASSHPEPMWQAAGFGQKQSFMDATRSPGSTVAFSRSVVERLYSRVMPTPSRNITLSSGSDVPRSEVDTVRLMRRTFSAATKISRRYSPGPMIWPLWFGGATRSNVSDVC
jgi:transposase